MAAPSGHILRIGVTGGIGSGKSLVCAMFSRLGVPVLSADSLAKEVMVADPSVRSGIIALLGSSAYERDGSLNRAYIASKIFSSKDLQKRMNAIVHPRVEAGLDREMDRLEAMGAKMAIVEAALIYEAGYDKRLDLMVVVDADERARVKRIVERDRTTPEEVRNRIRSQMIAERKVRRADFVIRNDGTIEELEERVKFLHRLFTFLGLKR